MDSQASIFNKIAKNLKKDLDKNLCVCNEVPKRNIINAIINGATTLDEVKQKTYATMGTACCALQVQKLLDNIIPLIESHTKN